LFCRNQLGKKLELKQVFIEIIENGYKISQNLDIYSRISPTINIKFCLKGCINQFDLAKKQVFLTIIYRQKRLLDVKIYRQISSVD